MGQDSVQILSVIGCSHVSLSHFRVQDSGFRIQVCGVSRKCVYVCVGVYGFRFRCGVSQAVYTSLQRILGFRVQILGFRIRICGVSWKCVYVCGCVGVWVCPMLIRFRCGVSQAVYMSLSRILGFRFQGLGFLYVEYHGSVCMCVGVWVCKCA